MKKFLSKLLVGSLLVTSLFNGAMADPTPTKDSTLPKDSTLWAKSFTQSLGNSEKGLANVGSITRGEFISSLVKALGLNKSITSEAFKDIKGTTYSTEIAIAKEFNLITGFADGSFKPNQTISQAEMATVLSRAFFTQTLSEEETNAILKNQYVNYNDIPKWARKHVALTLKENVLNSSEKKVFSNMAMSKEETSRIINRVISNETVVSKLLSLGAIASKNDAVPKGEESKGNAVNTGNNGNTDNPNVVAETELAHNMLRNWMFKRELSAAVPNNNGVVDTEKNWIFFANAGAQAKIERTMYGVRVTPTDIAGKPNYSLQLIQSPIGIEKLGIYKVSIVAKADSPRKLTLKVGATGDKGWNAYSMKELALTTEYKNYEYEFTAYGESDPGARFEIFLADDASPVDINRVVMAKTGVAKPLVTMEDLLKRTKTEADEDLVESWELAWSDEFDGNALDAQKWSAEIGNGAEKGIAGWGNGELQYYSDAPQNLSVKDGKLVIKAVKEQKNFTVTGKNYTTEYTSARLITDNKYSVKYGKIEARMKLPSGQGFWPAFWMLGQNIGEVGWPKCGEIDVLEFIGSKVTEVHGTVHGPVTAGPGINNKINTSIDMTKDFHTYAIEWDEDEVEFYVDGKLYHVVNKDEVAVENGPDEWVYDHEHFLLLNLAVGGTWPGAPSAETVFPSQLEVDYVRVYKDKNAESIDGQEVIDCENEKPATTPGVGAFSNGDFSKGKENWGSYFHYDASGTFEVVNQEAVLEVANDGNEDYSALIEQGKFKLDSTKTYVIKFDAKSSVPRTMITTVDNSSYSRPFSKKEALTADMKHFEYEFSGVQGDVTLKFLLGEQGENITAAQKIVIDNVIFAEKSGSSTAKVDGYKFNFDANLIKDSAFALWEKDQWSGNGSATMSTTGKSITVDITGVGAPYSPQVFQDQLLLESGEKYLLSFTASAAAPKTINVNVGKALSADPWWKPFASTKTIVLTPEEKTYNYIFDMTEATDNNGKIVFEFGGINGDNTLTQVSIKNINLVKLNSAIDNANWKVWEKDAWSGDGSAKLEVVGDKLTISVTGVGQAYSPQVYQEGLTFENASEYLVMFEAMSVLPKTINVNVGKALSADPWWTSFAPTRTLVLSNVSKLYAYSFKMNEATFNNGKIVFELGTVNGDSTLTDVTISNVGIYKNARILMEE